MQIVQVDVVGLETLQAGFDCSEQVAPGAGGVDFRGGLKAEFCGNDHLGSVPLEGLPEHRFGHPAAIQLGRIEMVDSGLDGGLNDCRCLLLVAPGAEVISSQPNHREAEAGSSKLSVL